jgi:LysR family transcriptional regulator, carnitine catabolism transcriptional activator
MVDFHPLATNIKYRPLKAFLLAVELGSFTHAAERVGVTQPSFTALIHDLEGILGAKLFDRTTRSIELTAAGREFASRIARPVADLEEAYSSIFDLVAVKRGSVTLGALPSTALALIPSALRALRLAHPTLRVRMVEAHNDALIAMVRTNQVEFALATMLKPAADIAFHPIIQDRFFAVFPRGHELATRRSVRWRDLVPHDLILLSQGSSARAQFDRAVQERAPTPGTASRYDVTHMTTAIRLVRQGLGITLLPRLALPELNLGDLSARPLDDVSALRTIGMIHRGDRSLSAAALAFSAQIEQVVAAVEKTLPPLHSTQRNTPRSGRRGTGQEP